MENLAIFSAVITLAFTFFTIYWMIKMLSFTKQSRIIHSMTLKTILKYCESKGVTIDIQKIQNEVIESID